ncbi:MAG TPA: M48 family metalloprotease [Kofleriaceae bacterium]|nr:M48 family metalloprotease [Kofleriaceae bacterium]
MIADHDRPLGPKLVALYAFFLALIVELGACGKPAHYLGASVPRPCTTRDVDRCLGWMAERDLHAAELDLYEDRELRGYIQGVADRLAKGSILARAPRVVIADRDDTYATAGGRIVIARRTLEKLESEAELAGVLAHEIAHVEGQHSVVSLFGRPPDEGLVNRRDAEGIADERAVALLERAGYAPTAMARALANVLESEDDEHPLRADRIARVAVLAGGRGGFEGRDELLHQLEHMVVGRDPRLGHLGERAWIVPALGLALDVQTGDRVRSAAEVLALHRDGATLVAYAVGAPWGKELVGSLEDRQLATSDVGPVTMGLVPVDTRHDDSPLGKLVQAVRSTLPQPTAGSRVVIVERPKGTLVIEIGGTSVPNLHLREATAGELADATPARIVLVAAPRAGTLGELGVCAVRALDDPSRVVAAGELVKCADRLPPPGDAYHRPEKLSAAMLESRRDESRRARDTRAARPSPRTR